MSIPLVGSAGDILHDRRSCRYLRRGAPREACSSPFASGSSRSSSQHDDRRARSIDLKRLRPASLPVHMVRCSSNQDAQWGRLDGLRKSNPLCKAARRPSAHSRHRWRRLHRLRAVRHLLIATTQHEVLNVDKLTYAGNLASLAVASDPRYAFVRVDICDRTPSARLFADFEPDTVIHLAAESHVDRSIDGPGGFMRDQRPRHLLAARMRRSPTGARLRAERAKRFRFHHVSTDEVYGSLGPDGPVHRDVALSAELALFGLARRRPIIWSRAWHHTYGLPVLITNCSNNYGPYHFPEKLIPLMILNALEGKPLPVYGDGRQVRDWLYVEDHARALQRVLDRGQARRDLQYRRQQRAQEHRRRARDLRHPRRAAPRAARRHAYQLITFVPDRPGHDRRYAIDASQDRTRARLGAARDVRERACARPSSWYLDNRRLVCERVRTGRYRRRAAGRFERERAERHR